MLETACKAAQTIERPAARGQALSAIAETWLSAGETSRGQTTIEEALKVADLLKHPDEKARQLAWLARLLKETGDTSKAIEQFKRAYYLARAAESVSLKVNALYNLSSEYVDAGLPAESKTVLAELELMVLDPASEVDTVCELINMAEIYIDLEEAAEAAKILTMAVQSAHALKDVWFKAERLIEIAEIDNSAGYRDEAARLVQEALSEVEHIEENSRPYFWMKLAAVCSELDLKTQSADCLLKAREAILKSADLPTAAGDVLELAENYLNLDDRITSLDLLEKAQTIIGDLPEDQDRIQCLLQSADLYRKLGQAPQAGVLTEKVYQLCTWETDHKAKLYTLGKLAILNVNLNKLPEASELVDEITRLAAESKTRTSGLGPIGEELTEAGADGLGLILGEIIREPEVKVSVLIAAAQNQIKKKA